MIFDKYFPSFNNKHCISIMILMASFMFFAVEGIHIPSTTKTNRFLDDNDPSGNFTLPEFNISTPNCDADTSGTEATVNILCNYEVAVPLALNESAIESTIVGFSNCSGNAVDGITITSELKGDNKDNYEVSIEVVPDSTEVTSSVEFCLKTDVLDDQRNIMNYWYQLLAITIDFAAGFNVSLSSSEFDGFNEIAADLGTVEFPVEAFRCNSDKGEVDNNINNALTIDDALYVCIRSLAEGIVVNDVIDFNLRKGDDVGYKAVDDGERDFNTFVQGEGSDVVLVGTRGQASLYEDNSNIIIEGSALLGSSDTTRRYLARFTQELIDSTSNFEIQVEVIKADSTVAIIPAADTFASVFGTVNTIVIAAFVLFVIAVIISLAKMNKEDDDEGDYEDDDDDDYDKGAVAETTNATDTSRVGLYRTDTSRVGSYKTDTSRASSYKTDTSHVASYAPVNNKQTINQPHLEENEDAISA